MEKNRGAAGTRSHRTTSLIKLRLCSSKLDTEEINIEQMRLNSENKSFLYCIQN